MKLPSSADWVGQDLVNMAKGREVAGSEAGMPASSWMADEGEDMMTNIFYLIKGKPVMIRNVEIVAANM